MKSLFEKEEKENALIKLKLDLISLYFPFSKEEILRYKSIIRFDEGYAMANQQIPWDDGLFETSSEKIAWKALYQIKNFQFTYSFLKKHSDKIDFQSIDLYKNLEWTNEILEEFQDKLDWSRGLILKPEVHTLENLRKYKDQINWQRISSRSTLVHDENIIQEFIDKWDWELLSGNPNLPISVKFIQLHIKKLNFNILSRNPKSLDLIHQYPMSDKWNWSFVITNSGIHYTYESFQFYFKYYKDHLQKTNPNFEITDTIGKFIFLERIFQYYSGNKSIFFDHPFINLLQFTNVVKGPSCEVPLSFILENKEKIDFNSHSFIKANKEKIDSHFIKQNLERFDPSHSSFYYLDINQDILSILGSKVDWFWLSSCETLDWTWEFIANNFDKLNPHRLGQNKAIYEQLIASKLTSEDIIEFLEVQLNS